MKKSLKTKLLSLGLVLALLFTVSNTRPTVNTNTNSGSVSTYFLPYIWELE